MAVRLFVESGTRLAGVRPATLRARARRLLAALRRTDRALNVVLLGDAEMRRLNRTHRKIDRPTDVLSFPMDETVLGDVVLNLDAARRQAREPDGWARAHAGRTPGTWSPLEEATLLLVHGVLHLLGFDHHRAADARRMRAEERRLFTGLTSRRPTK